MRDVIPSIQVLINCGKAGTCNGGDSHFANGWIFNNGIPDVTCQQYQSKNMEVITPLPPPSFHTLLIFFLF
jgi:hypothetical protein